MVSVACLRVKSFDDVSPYDCLLYFNGSVWVAEWPPFGK